MVDGNGWGKCSGLRTLFPSLLSELKKVIYVDTDTIFVDSPNNLWKHFTLMNGLQVVAAAPDQPLLLRCSYNQETRFPSPPGGLQSGVMLMNLQLMRRFRFEKIMFKINQYLRNYFVLPDQDALNVFGGLYPEMIYMQIFIFGSNYVLS